MPSQQASTGHERSGLTFLFIASGLKRFSTIPAVVAVTKAINGRATVMIGSSKAYVMDMESTPDSGVEMRKAVIDPLLAPCFRSDTAAGNTPQDHKGIGMPRTAALNTETNRPRPRCLDTRPGLRNTRNNPATIKPKSIYTEESTKSSQDACNALAIKSNFNTPLSH